MLTIRTRFTPAVTLSPGVGQGAEGGGGIGGAVGRIVTAIVQPEVEAGPVIYAPAGRPGGQWALWAGLALVAGAWAARRMFGRA